MDEFNKFVVSNNSLYGFAGTSASASYNNVLGNFVVNNTLYNYPNEFDISNILYENNDTMNCKDTQHENVIVDNRFQ
ncbi:16559_t:CDS:1, partial [Dentiscutata heterogama]